MNIRPIDKLKIIWNQPVSGIVELWAASLTVAWGIWVLIPWDTFDASHAYDLMARIMPEWGWGIIFVVVGLMKLVAFFCSPQKVRRRAILLVIFLWSIIFSSSIAGIMESKSASPLIFLHIILLLSFIYLKLGHEVNVNGSGN